MPVVRELSASFSLDGTGFEHPLPGVAGGINGSQDEPPATYATLQLSRFLVTIKTCVSKIFPAGFMWEGFALAAAAVGETVRRDGSVGTYALTGFGDGAGVFVGHMLFLAVTCCFAPFDLEEELKVAWFLACASFLSGGTWQFIVNVLVNVNMTFYPVALITGAVCGFMFFCGLRGGRYWWGEKIGWKHLLGTPWHQDAQLALSIAGSSALFVATDTGVADNPLREVFGVTGNEATAYAMFLAGASTFCGFLIVQMLQNLVWPRGSAWLDPAPPSQKRDSPLLGSPVGAEALLRQVNV